MVKKIVQKDFKQLTQLKKLILEYTGKHSHHKVSDPSKDNSTTVHQAHTVAQITMKTLINRSVLDVGQVSAKMDHKRPNTARS